MSRNEAAERLPQRGTCDHYATEVVLRCMRCDAYAQMNDALAAEHRAGYEDGQAAMLDSVASGEVTPAYEAEIRRATVERIREALVGYDPEGQAFTDHEQTWIHRILDEEAAR